MDTKEIIDQLNNETNEKYGFSLKDAILDAENETLNIELYYNDGVILSQSERSHAEEFLKSKFPFGFNYNFKFIKNFITKDTIIPKINEFFASNLPSVLYSIAKVEKQENTFFVELNIEDQTYDHFVKKDGSSRLAQYLNNHFCVSFDIQVNDNIIEEVVEDEEELVFDIPEKKENRFVSITDVEAFIGEVIDSKPCYIKDVIGKEAQDVCICGKVKFLKELSYERKSKKKENDNNTAEDLQEQSNLRIYYKWQLEGFTGNINCIYFTTKLTKQIMPQLNNGDEIVVVGDMEKSKFGDSFTLKIKKISRCKRPEAFEEKVEFKTENINYIYINPEPIEITQQVDLFAMVDQETPAFLKDKNFVVYDFETTGLNLQEGAKIIEIGAVKVIDGKIKEQFACMVNPQEHIPEDSTKIHGITDNDVKNAHTIDEVMQDFYKFTRGCILSGYNIVGFDMNFLLKYGKDCRYNFDNEVVDVYTLATQNVRGVKNYKLKTIAEKLGVSLENAHRAVHDARATAEVLIKIAENLKN